MNNVEFSGAKNHCEGEEAASCKKILNPNPEHRRQTLLRGTWSSPRWCDECQSLSRGLLKDPPMQCRCQFWTRELAFPCRSARVFPMDRIRPPLPARPLTKEELADLSKHQRHDVGSKFPRRRHKVETAPCPSISHSTDETIENTENSVRKIHHKKQAERALVLERSSISRRLKELEPRDLSEFMKEIENNIEALGKSEVSGTTKICDDCKPGRYCPRHYSRYLFSQANQGYQHKLDNILGNPRALSLEELRDHLHFVGIHFNSKGKPPLDYTELCKTLRSLRRKRSPNITWSRREQIDAIVRHCERNGCSIPNINMEMLHHFTEASKTFPGEMKMTPRKSSSITSDSGKSSPKRPWSIGGSKSLLVKQCSLDLARDKIVLNEHSFSGLRDSVDVATSARYIVDHEADTSLWSWVEREKRVRWKVLDSVVSGEFLSRSFLSGESNT